MNRALVVTALASLAWFVGAGTYVASHQSATWDETAHIGAGVAYLRGDMRLNPEHPPLMKALAALALPARTPALAIPEGDPRELQWRFGSSFLHGADQSPLTLLARARLPILLSCALLLPLTAAWAYMLGGPFAAGVALVLTASSPLWLAHATLVTTDAGATLFYFGAAFFAARIGRASPLRRSDLLGLAACTCLALMTKYSMLVMVGLLPLALWLDAGGSDRRPSAIKGSAACAFGALLGVSLAWGLPIDPTHYVYGVKQIGANHIPGMTSYALGHVFRGRFLGYFIVALGVKVCLPILALLALAPLSWGQRTTVETEASSGLSHAFVIPPLGLLGVMSFTAPPLGVRYVLPVLPFMIVLASASAALLVRHAKLRWVLLPLMAVQGLGVATALRATPIAYFNGLGCFTGEAVPCLDDSNVDWGQALPALRDFRDARFPGTPIRIVYFGSSPPDAYVPGASVANDRELADPLPALYAVSLHTRTRIARNAWPRRRPPIDIVGGSYAVYDLRK